MIVPQSAAAAVEPTATTRAKAEQKRRAMAQILGIENALKVFTGELSGLIDKNLMTKKMQEEKTLQEKVNTNPEWKKEYGWAWDSIATAVKRSQTMFIKSNYRGVSGRLATTAINIVRYVNEIKKPNGERLPQYQDANLASTNMQLYSPAPIYPDLEELQLADRIKEASENLGNDDNYVKILLDGKTPEAQAKELVSGTKLADPSFRKTLVEGGIDAVNKSTDPMIILARKLVPYGDEMREWMEKNVNSVITSASEKIAKARFAVYGKNLYPDANFTLRLSYGTVKGYPMNGTKAPVITTMYGLYDRAISFGYQGDFGLPKRFTDNINKLSLATPMNFITTNDIIGGNSGSPVINANGEVVGLVFDGNIESLPGSFIYEEEKNRTIAVHPGVMIETLRKLYDASSLANEIENVKKK